jgi:hypothetical protein
MPFYHKGKLLLEDLDKLSKAKIINCLIQTVKALIRLRDYYDSTHG